MKKKFKILIVEDSNDDFHIVSQLISKSLKYNFVIERTENKKDTLKLFKSFKPDCLLIDYLINDTNGLEIFKEINQKFGKDKVATIFLTGFGSEELVAEIMKAGASDYISKSNISSINLVTSIVNAIEKTELKRNLIVEQSKLKKALEQSKEQSELKSRFFCKYES